MAHAAVFKIPPPADALHMCTKDMICLLVGNVFITHVNKLECMLGNISRLKLSKTQHNAEQKWLVDPRVVNAMDGE